MIDNKIRFALAAAATFGLIAGTVGCAASTAKAEPPKPKGFNLIHVPKAIDDVVTVCDHGNRLYVATHHGGISVIANDPTCAEVPK